MRIDFKNVKQLSSEEVSQKEIKYAVENAKLQLSADILTTESSLADKKAELEEAKTTYPLNSLNIVNLEIDVENLEDGLRRLKNLKNEFGW